MDSFNCITPHYSIIWRPDYFPCIYYKRHISIITSRLVQNGITVIQKTCIFKTYCRLLTFMGSNHQRSIFSRPTQTYETFVHLFSHSRDPYYFLQDHVYAKCHCFTKGPRADRTFFHQPGLLRPTNTLFFKSKSQSQSKGPKICILNIISRSSYL